MKTSTVRVAASVGLGLLLCALPGRGEDWPMFGRDTSRNAVSPEKGAPTTWKATKKESLGVRWETDLGTNRNCGSPVVAGGLVWVGTNNGRPRDPRVTEDAAVLMCFRARDGRFLWQYVSPRLGNDVQDPPRAALNCSPLAEGDRLYFTTNRCEVVCLDVGPLRAGKGEPRVVWKLDMRKDLGVSFGGPWCPAVGFFTCSIGASYRGRLYVSTGNGVGEDDRTVPAPDAPSLVCLDRDTGKVLWSDNSPGKNILYSQWSSPLLAEVRGRAQVIAGQGDGWVRSFDALTGKLIWKFDTNPRKAEWKRGGRGTRNYIVSTPVFREGRVYIANGRSAEDGDGEGHLWCIDPSREPANADRDLSPVGDNFDPEAPANKGSGLVWHFGGPVMPRPKGDEREWVFGRTMSTVVVHNGLVVVPDVYGNVYCLDAQTGRPYWTHDAKASITASPLVVDGNVYVPTQDGTVQVLALSKEKRLVADNDVEDPIFASPVFANGVLYLATDRKLLALSSR